MKLTPEQRAELKALATCAYPVTGHIHPLREAVLALLADLEEAEGKRANGNMILVPADKLAAMQTELAATRKQLAEAQAQMSAANRIVYASTLYQGSDNYFTVRKLLTELGTAALDAAIAEAVAPYKRGAERYQYLREIGVMLDGHDFLSAGEVADNRIDAAMAAKGDK